MSIEGKHDEALLNVLKEERQILPFLNAIFGFLYRRTDFYHVQENPSAKVGFPPGLAEKTVRDTFRKWQRIACQKDVTPNQGDLTDIVMHEEEVVTSDTPPEAFHIQENKQGKLNRENDLSSDMYNGADCGNYRWSQTLTEVDIKVPVDVMSRFDVKVDIQPSQLTVERREMTGQWITVVSGQLAYKHYNDESVWSLLRGATASDAQISIHLEKAGEKWWDRLLTSESPVDLSKLDVTRLMTDLPEEDHMQVERIMAEEERRRLGLPSLEQQEQLETLKKAWDVEGSPFKGKPFDPSVLQLPQSFK